MGVIRRSRASSVQVSLLSVCSRKNLVPKNHHSSPIIQPYATILKWRGVWWSGLQDFRAPGASARPQARHSSFDEIFTIFRFSIFHRKNIQNRAIIGPFDPGRRGSRDPDAPRRLHPPFLGQQMVNILKNWEKQVTESGKSWKSWKKSFWGFFGLGG